MLAMAQDLIRHKWYADARLLTAIEAHPAAAEDQPLRDLLHHILLANRFWLMQFLEKPFAHEKESRAPETITQIVALFRETQAEEREWLSRSAYSGFHPLAEGAYPSRLADAQIISRSAKSLRLRNIYIGMYI